MDGVAIGYDEPGIPFDAECSMASIIYGRFFFA